MALLTPFIKLAFSPIDPTGFIAPKRNSQSPVCYDLFAQSDITISKDQLTTIHCGFEALDKLETKYGKLKYDFIVSSLPDTPIVPHYDVYDLLSDFTYA